MNAWSAMFVLSICGLEKLTKVSYESWVAVLVFWVILFSLQSFRTNSAHSVRFWLRSGNFSQVQIRKPCGLWITFWVYKTVAMLQNSQVLTWDHCSGEFYEGRRRDVARTDGEKTTGSSVVFATVAAVAGVGPLSGLMSDSLVADGDCFLLFLHGCWLITRLSTHQLT